MKSPEIDSGKEYPFHIFHKNGSRIGYFKNKNMFCELSRSAYNLLKVNTFNNNQSNLKNSKVFQECNDEKRTLEKLGFFDKKNSEVPIGNINKKAYFKTNGTGGIVLDVAQTCNLNCSYCYGGGGNYGSNVPLMDYETANAAINFLMKQGNGAKRFQIVFFGGEPLLNFPTIKYIVNLCNDLERNRKISFIYSITTNGTILNEEIIYFLIINKFRVMVSYDGEKNIHDKYRRFKNGATSYDLVADNIKLLSGRIPIQARGTIVNETINYRVLKNIMKNVEKLRIKKLLLSPADCSKIDANIFNLNPKNIKKLDNIFDKITERNLLKLRKGDRQLIPFDPYAAIIRNILSSKKNKSRKCGAFSGMSTIDTKGDIYPCHRFVGLKSYVIGNVCHGLDENKKSGFIADISKALSATCPNCWLEFLCGGQCYYYLATKQGTFESPKKEICESIRRRYETALYFIVKYRDLIVEKPYIYMKLCQ